jgi:transcriptional regulator with GAF, ATPase, and Fis domain
MARPLAMNEVSRPPAAASFYAPGEKATRDGAKLDRILHNLAASALQETGASSVAIGLDGEGTMICRAVAGMPLADLGAPINTESGLTGMAIRRQMSQWCSDTESDLRVDVEVCRQLGVRSIIVVPVLARDTVVGLFAIFSPNPDTFSLSELNQVKELAHSVSEAVETASRRSFPQIVAPALADPEHSRGRQPGGVKEPAHTIRNYAVRIWRAIARIAEQNGNPG